MNKFLIGIYYTIHGYISEAQTRRDYLKCLIEAARNAEYEEDALKAYEDEYERLGKEIQKLSKLAEAINIIDI